MWGAWAVRLVTGDWAWGKDKNAIPALFTTKEEAETWIESNIISGMPEEVKVSFTRNK
jgi:hypothetical protein